MGTTTTEPADLSEVIQVLRMPDAPNMHYHRSCYTPRKEEPVLRVIQFLPGEDHLCGGCHQSVRTAPLQQPTLF